MVIPVGSLGDALHGPAPPELRGRFNTIKYCVLVMIVSTILRLMAGALMGRPYPMLASSFNLILNTVVGIFLLYDDEHLGPLYRFMMQTCCQPCADQCRGGMSCLMAFVLCNLITVVMDVLLNGYVQMIIHGFDMLLEHDSAGSTSNRIAFALYLLSVTGALVSQAIGTWQGWKAYQEAQTMGVSVVAGDEGWRAPGAGANGGGGGNFWSGGRGGRQRDQEMEEPPRQQGARPAQGFTAFSGAGHRLGGE